MNSLCFLYLPRGRWPGNVGVAADGPGEYGPKWGHGGGSRIGQTFHISGFLFLRPVRQGA